MSSPAHRSRSAEEVQGAWGSADAGAHYGGPRWASASRRERDGRRLAKLLERHGRKPRADAHWLDVACGTGRLPGLWRPEPSGYIGIDASPSMLGEHPLPGRVLCASAFALPFPDDAFELVVACRFLHHLADSSDLIRAARELVRVSSSLVAVTFWDKASLADWKRPKRGSTPGDPRVARSRAELEQAFDQAGGELIGVSHSFRFVSRQAYALVRVR